MAEISDAIAMIKKAESDAEQLINKYTMVINYGRDIRRNRNDKKS